MTRVPRDRESSSSVDQLEEDSGGAALGDPRAPNATRAYVTLAGRQCHYRMVEPRSEVRAEALLLHQVSSSSRMFERLMQGLRLDGIRSFAPDLPGFGQSDPMNRYTIRRMAEWAMVFSEMVARGRSMWVVGHHTGSAIAVEMALARPEAVRGLILVGLPYFSSEKERSDRWKAKRVRRIVPTEDGEHLLHEWRRLKDLAPGVDLAVLHREATDTFQSHRYDLVYRALWNWTRDEDAKLPTLTCPVTVVAGTNDHGMFRWQRGAASLIHNAELLILEGAGVFAFDECVEELQKIVTDRVVPETINPGKR
jgi:pimeloyl-ACP methyl ester carboxylesterase